MSELWVDTAGDYCSSDLGCGRGLWYRLAFRLFIVYLFLATLCWIELKFRKESIEVDARFEIVGSGPSHRGTCNSVNVRYNFTDPVTGKPRMNTEVVRMDRVPSGRITTVEYIPGEYPWSRLKSEAYTGTPALFLWVNVIFFTGVVGLIGYIAWEANHPIGGRKRHRIPRNPVRSPKRWTIA